MNKIQEDFLYYVWMTKQFDHSRLQTMDGESIVIKEYGTRNPYSGPDFSNAQIQIGDTLWAGNVEMHIFSSDWEKHKHHNDDAYNNVILHVVFEHDKDISFNINNPKKQIPTLALKSLIDKHILDTYNNLLLSKSWIPCENLLKPDYNVQFDIWKYNLTTQRLWLKTSEITTFLEKYNYGWETVTYILLCRYFGGTANKIPFERLAINCPLKLIQKNRVSLTTITALYFGQAGFLQNEYPEEYVTGLRSEYMYLKNKYNLTPIDPSTWKFGGIRPQGLPTFRLAQFIGLMYTSTNLFSKLLSATNLKEYYSIFQIETDDYWKNHYTLVKKSRPHQTDLSRSFIHRLIINVVVPILFLYGKETGKENYVDKSISLLESVPPEKNTITDRWTNLGFSGSSAFDSQALIHLKKEYCNKIRCMQCRIGHHILSID